MKCTQCKSTRVKFDPNGELHTGGKIIFGKQCESCGYYWSDEVAPTEESIEGLLAVLPGDIPDGDLAEDLVNPGEIAGEDNPELVEDPDAEELLAVAGDGPVDGKTLVTAEDGFEVETLAVGQEVLVKHKGAEVRGTVNRIGNGARGKVNVEVPGAKDLSVGKKSVLGRFERLAE